MRKALLAILFWMLLAFSFVIPAAAEETDAGSDPAVAETDTDIDRIAADPVTTDPADDTTSDQDIADQGNGAPADTGSEPARGAQKARPQEAADDKTSVYVSASGNDEDGDGTEAKPFATIQKAYGQSSSVGTIVLLSNIDQKQSVSVDRSLTITSKGGPYTVKRASAFSGPMFALNAIGDAVELIFENVVLDDSFTAATGNDGVISVRSGTAILGDKATLKNYGGTSGVHIVGGKSKFIMKAGSLITTNGTQVKGQGAVWNESGHFRMEQGAAIDRVNGSGIGGVAVLSRNGNNYIDGTVSNCKSKAGDYSVINLAGGVSEIGPNAKIFGNTSLHGTIYVISGAKLTVRGEIYNNTTDAANTWCSGIYAADNGAPAYVYIEDGAYIHNNSAYAASISPYTSAVFANNTSYIIMNGGRIVNNSTRNGVMVRKNGHFTMNGGEISGQTTGVKVENYLASENGSCRVLLLGGKLSNSGSDICISRGANGYMTGSLAYLSSDMTAQSLKVNYERVDTTSIFGLRFDYSTTLKTITTDKSMKEVYLSNASTSGDAAIRGVPEVAAGNLITTWFTASEEDFFKMIVSGIGSISGDVLVCIVPVDENGTALDGYKIYQCDKTTVNRNTVVTVSAKGTGNAAGYAVGLFANKELPVPETYTLHYDTAGGTVYADRTGLSFTDTDLAPEEDPVREGYRFLGWYMDAELKRAYASTNSYADIVENETTAYQATLYAAWEEIPKPEEPAQIEPMEIKKSSVLDDFEAPQRSKAAKAKTKTKSAGTAAGDGADRMMLIMLLIASIALFVIGYRYRTGA